MPVQVRLTQRDAISFSFVLQHEDVKQGTGGSVQHLCSPNHASIIQSSGSEYDNPGSGSLASGAGLIKQDYKFKSVGQLSGSCGKVG